MGATIVIAVVAILLVCRAVLRRVQVQEHQRVILYKNGRFIKVYEPGHYWLFAFSTHRVVIDIRRRLRTIPAQELLTADGIGVKVTVVVEYEIVDPHLSVSVVEDLQGALYLACQLALRDIVSAASFDELMEKRPEIGALLIAVMQPQALELGTSIHRLEIKDLMLPGDLKKIYAQVAEAKQQALASLERARGQVATMRSLANAAKMLDENPGLWKLRLLETMQQPNGNTFVLSAEGQAPTA